MVKVFDYRDKTSFLVLKALAATLFFEFLTNVDLWSGNKVSLQFPVFDFIPAFPQPLGQWFAIALMLLLVIAVFHPKEKICQRALLLFVVPWVFLMLQDLNRVHPFSHMGLIVYAGLAISYFRGASSVIDQRVNNGFRLFVCCLYIWAGFWKLNPEFFKYIIPDFLSPVTSTLLGITGPGEVVSYFLKITYFLVPFLEIAVGVLFFFPRTRHLGMILAGAMLGIVLIYLGPWGVFTGKITDVLFWNIFLFSLDIILFANYRGSPLDILIPRSFYQKFVMLFAGVLPLLSVIGLWPTLWSFRLWAGGVVHTAEVRFKAGTALPDAPHFFRQPIVIIVPPMNVLMGLPSPMPEVYVTAARKLCAYTTDPDHMKLMLHTPHHFWLVDEPRVSVSYPCRDKP